MSKRKIAFLLSHPIQYFSPLFKRLAERADIDLMVLYCSDEGARKMRDKGFGADVAWDIPLLDGYRYKILQNNSPIPTVSNAPWGLMNFGVVKEVKEGEYDAIILHGWHYVTLWLAYITARLSKVPVFLHSENPYNQEIKKPRWKLAVKKALFGPLLRGCDGVFSIGTENRRFYEYYGVKSDRIFPVPYAVDNERFMRDHEQHKHRKNEFRDELGIGTNTVVILSTGKLIAKKRPMNLLRAFEKLDLADKALLFLGDGPLRKELESSVAGAGISNVHISGFRNQTELYKYYIVSDIFVMPSGMGETWGLAVNEAMCFGLPVVVSDLVGCGADLVRPNKNGFIFRTGDIDELARFISILAASKDERERFGRFSVETVKGFNYDVDIAGIIDGLQHERII